MEGNRGNWKSFFTKKKLLFIALFVLVAVAADHVRFSSLVGAKNQFFTLFQFIGPLPGAFLGAVCGVFVVFASQAINFFALGKEASLLNLVRLLPMLFAAYYFSAVSKKAVSNKVGKGGKWIVVVPLLCIALFISSPVGSQAWFFSSYWLIPVIAAFFFSGNLFARALGASFTAHAIGSTAWVYLVPMPASAWIALIPIVAFERLSFAVGITVSYIAFNVALDKLNTWNPRLGLTKIVSINPKYVLK